MQKIKSMKLTRCAEHMSFIYAQGMRLALYKGLHATAARLVQKMVAGAGSGNRALRVKLTKMLHVPGVAHWNAIFGLKADSARPSDSFHPVRAFPLRRLETSGFNFAAMVAAQSFLVARSSHSSLKTVLLKE